MMPAPAAVDSGPKTEEDAAAAGAGGGTNVGDGDGDGVDVEAALGETVGVPVRDSVGDVVVVGDTDGDSTS